MISEAHVDRLLEHWGREHWRVLMANKIGAIGPAPPSNPLADCVVHRTREKGARRELLTAHGRADLARRLIEQQLRAGQEHLPEHARAVVPTWAGGDPIRGKETRTRRTSSWQMDAIAEMVEQWVAQLRTWDPRAAYALRAFYEHAIEQPGAGARWVSKAAGMRVDRIGFLAGVARGRLAIRRAAASEAEKRPLTVP